MSADGPQQEMSLDEFCNQVRAEIERLKASVKLMRRHSIFRGEQARLDQHRDMQANIELSYRALEDGRMRLGKVIQEMGDGVSKYDKK